MRIAWVTPLGVQSAIAEYSINVAEALSKTSDIRVLASDPPPGATHPFQFHLSAR